MLICIAIAFLFYLLLFFYFYKRNHDIITLGTYFIALYLISAILTVLEDNTDKIYSVNATLFFLFILYLFLHPVFEFDKINGSEIKFYNQNLFRFICFAFIIGGVLAYAFFLPTVFRIFTSKESLLILRTDMIGGERYINVSYLYYIVTFACQFYPIVMIFYFFSITHLNYSKGFNNLLFFSSTAYIVNVLSVVGRDGIVLWTMSYIFSFILFYRYMSKEQIAIQKRRLKYLCVIFSFFFFSITIARFFIGGIDSGFLAITSYFGQQFGNFNNFFNRFDLNYLQYDITSILPIIPIGKENVDILTEHKNFISSFGFDKFVFSTFIGDFYINFGPLFVFIWAFIHALFNTFIIKKKRMICFGKILYITLISQLPLHGIFYYKLGYVVSNLYIVVMILMSVIFSYNLKSIIHR